MKFKELIDACDQVMNRDLIRLDTYCLLDSNGYVNVDIYHKLAAESNIQIVYDAVNVPFSFSYAIQEAWVTKNFDRFKDLAQTSNVCYDADSLPNYAIIKYKDYNIGRLYGVTHYKELFDCIERVVF